MATDDVGEFEVTWGRQVRQGLGAAQSALLGTQHSDGHWCAELEGDTILESEYVLTMVFLGLQGERTRKAANYLRAKQQDHGCWSVYPDGPPDLSASVKAYFALKLEGDDPADEHMVRARETILSLGGVDACNSFTKIYLAIFGQYEWSRCPAVVPEMVLLPTWLPFNYYAMSSWSRAIVAPLSIIWALKPHCPVPERASIRELMAGHRPVPPSDAGMKHLAWTAFFRAVDRSVKLLEALRLRPMRRRGIERCEAWILERLEKSDGLGAIFPPIINCIVAFRGLGYELDHPVLAGQIEELRKLEIEEADTLRVQPCKSPVWDTALAVNALIECGLDGDESVQRAAGWLLDREVSEHGDWKVTNPAAPVGGWYFEYANEFYPDCDDTAEIATALSRLDLSGNGHEERRRGAVERGVGWLLGMQNADGGWASFDRGCDREILTYIPFADHNAMIDPSTTDITARVLECLAAQGHDPESPAAARGVDFILAQQEEDGAWYGRWGCNYIYGTWLALQGLRAIGLPPNHEAMSRGAEWLERHQNEDGGWGELPASYDDPSLRGQGPSTAAQTAWALMGLMAAGRAPSESVRRGFAYLLDTQLPDGSWVDEHWTGTGFPKVFYLRYHLYSLYFPLRAMATYDKLLQRAGHAGVKVA